MEKIKARSDMKVNNLLILGQKNCPACRIIELVLRKMKREIDFLDFQVYRVSVPEKVYAFPDYQIGFNKHNYIVKTDEITNLPQTHFLENTTLLGKQLGLPRIPDKLEYTEQVCELYMLSVFLDIYNIIGNKIIVEKLIIRMTKLKELINDDGIYKE